MNVTDASVAMSPSPDSHPRRERPSRRAFLKSAGLAVAGAGLAGCATKRPASSTRALRVRIEAPADALVDRAFAILADRIGQRCPTEVVRADRRPGLILRVDHGLAAEAFRIDERGGAVRVAAGSSRGLLYGVGKLLRTSEYGDGFRLSAWRGESRPDGSLRGMYFASHFHNWYHQAPEAETARYLEDLTLWGANAVMVIFPMINLEGWDDPQAEPAMAMVRRHARLARQLGLQFTTGINNTMFIGAPQNIRATRLPDPTGRRGNSGHPICPSLPEGHEYLVGNTRRLCEKLSDVGLDILCHWPYDEGGCACARCQPWGSNGYLRLSRDLTAVARETFPKLKSVLSTWMFDTPPEGEWEGLRGAIARGEGDWIDWILADAHEDFPRYPLEVGVPGGRPLLNFPEISMWGNSPWGGVGANPLPGRFQRLWDQVSRVVAGGFPYSEGIYEDLNKAVVLQFYWDRRRSARETLREYVDYEFGPGVTDDALQLIDRLEQAASAGYQKRPVDTESVRRAASLAESIDARLPVWGRKAWRWEIVRLRALLDRERFGGGGLGTPAAEGALLRLIELYHAEIETDDPYHHRVRPPLKRAVSRRGNL